MPALATLLVPLLLTASSTAPVTADASGGAYLWLYAPWAGPGTTDVQLWAAYLDLDLRQGPMRLHLEPRASLQKVRGFYPGVVWIQEAYLAWEEPWVSVKAGALYDRLGRFWDDSFYGNLLFFDGIALDPGLGFSLEGQTPATDGPGLEWAAQLLLRDTRASGALDGRDALSLQDGFEGPRWTGRVAPFYRFASGTRLQLGASATRYLARLTRGDSPVVRYEADVSLETGRLTTFVEWIGQHGHSTEGFPLPGLTGASHVDYLWAGSELALGKRVAIRALFSWARYRDPNVREWLSLPGVTLTLTKNLALFGEVAFWQRVAPGEDPVFDRSANLVLWAHF